MLLLHAILLPGLYIWIEHPFIAFLYLRLIDEDKYRSCFVNALLFWISHLRYNKIYFIFAVITVYKLNYTTHSVVQNLNKLYRIGETRLNCK